MRMTEELKKTASNTARELRMTLGTRGLELSDGGNIRWSKRTRAHPRNWKLGRKVYNTGVISFLKLITLVRDV